MAKKIKISPVHEQVILGTMLKDPKCRARLVKSMSAEDFYVQAHRSIFAAIQELHEEGLEYIPATLKSFLPPEDEYGGITYLEKLLVLSANENIDFHVDKARWDTIRNTLLTDRIPALTALLQDPRTTPDVISHTLKTLEGYSHTDDDSILITGKSHIARYNAELYARGSGANIRSTGYMALDRKLTSPCKPGWVTVVAAAPSIGKTTFCLNMATRQSSRRKVGYLAWESGATPATDIICASELKIPLSTLLKHPEKLTRKQTEAKDELLEKLFDNNNMFSFLKRPPKRIFKKKSPWEINDAVLDWLDGVLETWGVDQLYWDLFEKLLADRRPQAISWALDRVQEIAQEHHVHITLLHQILLKEAEKQNDKRPTRYNLKGSGGYVETPDFVFGLYRRAIYERGVNDDELELHCLKQRMGPFPFRIVFDWEGRYGRVSGGREEQMTITDDDDYDGQV